MTKDERMAKSRAGGFRNGLKGPENPLSKIGRGLRKGRWSFKTDRERRHVAMLVYYDRMQGATIKELMGMYKMTKEMVMKMLKLAMSDDLVKQLEQKILTDIMPLALKVYKKKLEEGSEYVAKDVLQNFAKIADRNIKREELAKDNNDDEDSLEFLLKIKGKRTLSTGAQQLEEGEVIDGTVISDETTVQKAIEEGISRDFQAIQLESPPAEGVGLAGSKNVLPAAIRKQQSGEFVSIRDLLRSEGGK